MCQKNENLPHDQNSLKNDTDFESILKSAHDFREQLQSKHHKNKETLADDEFSEKFRQHLKYVYPFVTDDDISEILSQCLVPKLQTQYDCPLTHYMINSLEDTIVQSLKLLGYDLLDGVSLGVTDKEGLSAEQLKLIMTNASIININADLFLTITRFSKLIAKSLPLKITGNEIFHIDFDKTNNIYRNLNDPTLQFEWDNFFADHALSLKHPPRGPAIQLNSLEQSTLSESFSTCMQIFVIAHEYGHHVKQHSTNELISSDSCCTEEHRKDEFEADRVAFEVSTVASTLEEHFEISNFLYTNVGALLVFLLFDYINMAQSILLTGENKYDVHSEKSHPSGPNRYRKFIEFIGSEYDMTHLPTIEKLHVFINELTDYVWCNSQLHIKKMYLEGIRPIDTSAGWLP